MLNIEQAPKPQGKSASPVKDISYCTFGHLTVLFPSDERDAQGAVKWVCICDCTKLVLRTHASLKRGGENTNCSCMKAQIARQNFHGSPGQPKKVKKPKAATPRIYEYADISHKRFGMLEVICPSDQREGAAIKWKCKCDCGEIVYRSHRVLKAGGKNSSCGCLIPQIRRERYHRPAKAVDGTFIALLESKKLRTDNKSGVRGVFYIARRDKWRAEIRFQGKTHHLGIFRTKEEAVAARTEAESRLHQPAIDRYYATGKISFA